MNRVQLLLLAAVLPAFASCSDSSATAPLPEDGATFARSQNVSRPFDGRCDTQISFAAPQPGDPAASQRLHITYVCQLQHLGRTTAVADQILLFTGPNTVNASNTTVYTAANGDKLYSTWTGTGVTGADGGVVFSGTEMYSGGTGRFAGSAGSSFISGTGSFAGAPPFAGQFTLNGTLAY